MPTQISAKLVAHSLNMAVEDKSKRYGHPEIGTFEVVFPRYILAELNTHRMFSRNSASSRAIPFKKMVEMVKNDPFIPIAWQKDHPGMQGTEYLSKTEKFNLSSFVSSLMITLNTLDKESKEYKKLENEISEKAELIEGLLSAYKFLTYTLDEWWLLARDKAVEAACFMHVFRVTKQLANRLLEPFMWHKVIITATEFNNFFALRCPVYIVNEYNMYDEKLNTNTYKSRIDLIRGEGHNGDGKFRTYIHENDSPSRFKRGEYTDQFTEVDWLEMNKGMADIHMMALAEAMWNAWHESTPKQLQAGEWHIPYLDKFEDDYGYVLDGGETSDEMFLEDCIKISTAMCARVSYTVVGEEKEINFFDLIKLHDEKLIPQDPLHASPMEHPNQAMTEDQYYSHWKTINAPSVESDSDTMYICTFQDKQSSEFGWSANMRGFIPYRMQLPNENVPG